MLEDHDPMTSDLGKEPTNPPRLISPQELALLCKMQREFRGWTQETLAELTGLQVRTVQRVENAEPSSMDTRRALARAFDASDVDLFNKVDIFPTIEEIEAKVKAEKATFERDYIKLALVPATGLLLMRELNGCGGFGAEVVDDGLMKSREARDAWGAFVDNARDWGDIADEVREADRMEAVDQIDEQIQNLERLGISLYVGTRKLVYGRGENAFPLRLVHVVGAPRGKAIIEIAVPRKVQMGI